MADILVMIETYKRAEIAAAKRARPLAELEQAAKAASAPRGFLRAIEARLDKKEAQPDQPDKGRPPEMFVTRKDAHSMTDPDTELPRTLSIGRGR